MGDRKYPYDLAIATTCYFGTYVHVDDTEYRLGLFRKLVESLARTRWGGIRPIWCIWDDNSPMKWFPKRPGRNLFTDELISGDIDIDMVCHVNSKGPSQNANVVDSLNEAQRHAPFTVCIDSDAIVHPEWVLRAMDLVEKYPNSNLYGLYNTKHHPVAEIKGFDLEDADTVLKYSNTVFGTLYRSEFRGQRALDEWCEHFVWRSPEHTPVIPVLKTSVIQHTGENGLNSVKGVTERDYDSGFEIEHD